MDIRQVAMPSVPADAPTGPRPVIADRRIHSLIVAIGTAPGEAQRVLAGALRRRSDLLAVGDGICPVVDARIAAQGVAVDLLVPPDARPIAGSGAIPGAALWSRDDVVGLLCPIVESLAALHDAGLAHGGIGRSSVMARADGRGVIIGFDPDATQSADITAIGDLALDLLPPGTITGQLASILTRAVDRGDHRQPSMAEIARGLADLSRDRLGVSPPAHRRIAQRPPADGESARVDAVGVDAVGVDPVVRLRRRGHARHAAPAVVPSQRRSGERVGADGHGTRASIRRSIPWPLVATALGSSILTWAVANAVG